VPQLLATNWEDKGFDYVHAWKHLAWNLKRMERLHKLTLVSSYDRHYIDPCETNETLLSTELAL
jgi:hypothetical protein